MPRNLKNTFTGGEISPATHARTDLNKYHTSVALMLNFFVHAHGGASTRAGLEFVGDAPDHDRITRVVGFSFNVSQTYVLVFGHQVMHVVKDGGLIIESGLNITNITAANPAVITITGHPYSSGDKVYITGTGVDSIDNKFHVVANTTANTFEISADGTGWSSGGTSSKLFELVTPYDESDLFDLKFDQSADVMTITSKSYQQRRLSRLSDTSWTLSAISFSTAVASPTALGGVEGGTGSGGGATDYKYVVTAVDASGAESLPSNEATVSTAANSLSASRYIRLLWNSGGGEEYYNVYKENGYNSGVFGFIGEAKAGAGEFRDYNFGPDMSVTPPQGNNPLNTINDYPACSAYHQQRQFFAATLNNPQTVYSTRTGNYNNMDKSRPTRADDAIEFPIVSRQVNEIRHLLSLDSLMVFTAGSVWRIDADQDGVLTPANVNPRRQGGHGCSNVPPIIVGETVLYIQEKGAKVRDLNYTFEADKYTGNDISIMAEHLFYGFTIVDWCYAEEPYGLIWAVRDDGKLLSLAYLREHQVWGWSQHETDGFFESVASVSEGNEDVVYAVVRRTINGSTKRYIERMHERRFTDIKDAFCVDSGLTYDGPATTTLTNLDHLEGKSVVALADGNVVENLTVSNGSVTLPNEASKIHIGLQYNCDINTLNVDFQNGETLQSRKKAISNVTFRVRDTRGLAGGQDENSLYEIKERDVSQGYGSIPPITGEQQLNIATNWTEGGQVYLRQRYPLPATILAIIPEVEVSG